MVACLVAGVGAWGAKVHVANAGYIYASELFGAGHAAIKYPGDKGPMVVLTIPANQAALDETENCPAVSAVNYNGSAEITFSLVSGVFASNVTGLLYHSGAADDSGGPASGDIASIVSGGRKDGNSITIKVEPAGDDNGRPDDNNNGARNDATCEIAPGTAHTISFELPRLAGLEGLAGANSLDTRTDNDWKYIWLQADSRIVSGSFTDGPLLGAVAPGFHATWVVRARDSLTLEISPTAGEKVIALDNDEAKGLTEFTSLKGAVRKPAGHVELATVTIKTKQIRKDAIAAAGQMAVYHLDNTATANPTPPATYNRTGTIFKAAVEADDAKAWDIYDLDGEKVTDEGEGLRGTFSVMAMGTRELFNDGDMLFIDYDKNGEMGEGEALVIDGSMAEGRALSIDADQSDSFDMAGVGAFKVYYMPGGKDALNHGATIMLTAGVDYSDPTAIDEMDVMSTTTLNFDGVTSEVMAYAIPHSTNGTGDKANVRVRCEASDGCRVFLECWDDMGMRSFGKAGMIEGNALVKWDAAAIEGVIDVEDPTSRHSCRILSAGMVTVQQLTRDGNSKTLVNNTYVGDGHAGVSKLIDAAEYMLSKQIKDHDEK